MSIAMVIFIVIVILILIVIVIVLGKISTGKNGTVKVVQVILLIMAQMESR